MKHSENFCVGVPGTVTLKYLGDRDYIMQKTDRFPINDDLKPYCEYYLGLIKKYKHSFKM